MVEAAWSYFKRWESESEVYAPTSHLVLAWLAGPAREDYCWELPDNGSFDLPDQRVEDDFQYFFEFSSMSSQQPAFPGVNVGPAGLVRKILGTEQYDALDASNSYAWLCLESLPPVEGLDNAPADWRGVAFFHSETEYEPMADYLVPFDHADCVAAEDITDPCNGDQDGVDNDYDGVVDEGTPFPDTGIIDCSAR